MEKEDHRHGTTNGYQNLGCRCELCKHANSVQMRKQRARRFASPTPAHVHGSVNGYGNWGCRCERCTDAWRIDAQKQSYRRRCREG